MKIINIREFIEEMSEKNIIEFLAVLNTLTNVYNDEDELKFMIKNFKKYILELPANVYIFVILNDNIIVGSGTIIIEQKIIHGFGRVGHIEDVVISNQYQGQGLGRKLINFLINQAKNNYCYKVILGCNNDKVNFYKKILSNKGGEIKISNQISYYL